LNIRIEYQYFDLIFSIQIDLKFFKVIKNIIFDLGVVIIDILDEQDWYQNHLVPLFGRDGLEKALQSDLFQKIETGTVSTNEFWQNLQQFSRRDFTLESLVNAWNARLKTISTAKMNHLLELSKIYPLWLLSNTNEIHLEWIKNHISETFGAHLFDVIFQKQYYSNELKMKKPEKDIYQFVLNDASILPHETVFIDDLLANLTMPAALGIIPIHFQNEEQFQKELSALLLS
jgi:HAD superfamily hydrolase (TIGR01509 family)